MGTAVGNHLYAEGGWIWSGSASVGFVCVALVICFLRGPHEQGWVGWAGGCKMRKPRAVKQTQKDEEKGAMGDQAPKLFMGGQADTEDRGDDKDVVVDLKTSDHSVNSNSLDKTLTLLEDEPSMRYASNGTKGNTE